MREEKICLAIQGFALGKFVCHAKGYYFHTVISSVAQAMFTKATICLCTHRDYDLGGFLHSLLASFTRCDDNPAEWLTFWLPLHEWDEFRVPEPEIQSYQVLLMCFQFPPILLAQPAEKRHQYYSEPTMLPVSVQDSFHIWLWPLISNDCCICLTPAPKHRLGLHKRSYGPNLSVSEWQGGNHWWQNCPSE